MKNATDESTKLQQIKAQIGLAIGDLMDDHVQNNLHRLGVLGADSVRTATTRLAKLFADESEA